MRQLIEHAAAHGLRTIYGDVLADNLPMLRLLESLGAEIFAHDDGPGLVRACIDLQASAAPASSCLM
jgi:RimJ/RimL family protein N-acetyltransferase